MRDHLHLVVALGLIVAMLVVAALTAAWWVVALLFVALVIDVLWAMAKIAD